VLSDIELIVAERFLYLDLADAALRLPMGSAMAISEPLLSVWKEQASQVRQRRR
jgi:hypothetical protein